MFVIVKGIDTKTALPVCRADSLCITAVNAQHSIAVADNNALLCSFTAGKLSMARLHTMGKSSVLTSTRWHSTYVLSLRWHGEELKVCVAAGNLPPVQVLAQTMQGRVLVLSLATLLGRDWCDGYLAHINAGQVLSYVARPGYLCMRVPLRVQEPAKGIDHLPVSLTQDWDYLVLQQALKSYVAREQLPLRIDDFSCAAAVCLVAATKALACTTVQIGMPNPAWKRLLQNLGLQIVAVGRLPVSQLLPLVKAESLAKIVTTINRRGAILPHKQYGVKLPDVAQKNECE